MKDLSPEKRTIAQNAWKKIKKHSGKLLTGATLFSTATYFLSTMGGEEIEDQALERDLGPQGGDPNNLRLYDPYIRDTSDFSVDEASADEFISVD